MKLSMKAEQTTLEIEVIGRSHPESLDYWDGNWVMSIIKAKIPGFEADFVAHLRTDELQQFLEELKSMRDTLKGKARLLHMEEQLELEGRIDGRGTVWWEVRLCHPVGEGAVLTFDFSFDQTYLHGMIKGLNDILNEYLVIRKQ